MGLAKEQGACVESPFAVEPTVEIAQAIEQRVEERPLRLDSVDDAAMDRLPQRGHADHRGRPHVGKCPRETRGVDAKRINHRGAERERQQHPAGELEGVMEREQRKHHVGGIERKDPREHRNFSGEIAVRQHHALGRAGGAGGEHDGGERLALRSVPRVGPPFENERTAELGELEFDDFAVELDHRAAQALGDRLRT